MDYMKLNYKMSVKPQVFEETKQKILKNKEEFIEIQLRELNKRIESLKNENRRIKAEIQQLKLEDGKKVVMNNKMATHREEGGENKENKCSNKTKLIEVTSAATHRHQIISLAANNKSTAKKDRYEENGISEVEIKQLQEKLVKQQQKKQQYLENLERQIKILKADWEKQQREIMNRKRIQFEQSVKIFNKRQSSGTNYQKPRVSQMDKINTAGDKGKTLLISVETLNQSKIEGNDSCKISLEGSLNNSAFMNDSYAGIKNSGNKINMNNYHGPAEVRRKTMSVNLSNGMNQMNGFVFGKKSMHKSKQKQYKVLKKYQPNLQRQDIELGRSNQRRVSSNSFSMGNSFSANSSMMSNKLLVNRTSLNTLNNSLTHSNSNRTSLSNLNSSKLMMRKSEASRSYAKIVTKLECKGCGIEFRPNEYYAHIEDCREYLKLKLLEEKELIEDEINQTLNLSEMNY